MSAEWCFICAGADDDPGFDECAVCGRKGMPMEPGAPPLGLAAHQSALGGVMRPESPLARAVRLARGDIEPDHVPHIIEAWNRGLLQPDLQNAQPSEAALFASPQGNSGSTS